MKALKALVIGMGILIVIGIGLVGFGLTRGKPQQATAVTQTTAPEIKVGPFTSELPIPPGARLEQVIAAGDRLVLRFSSAEGDKLVLLDSRTGQLAGTIALVPSTH
jgi:hypothetical protein